MDDEEIMDKIQVDDIVTQLIQIVESMNEGR